MVQVQGSQGDAPQTARRVLVVDDSRAQRRILSLQLQRWGFAVSEAGSGDEALEMCRATGFDLVLSDWMMPGMSGIELCRAFRALPREAYGYFILLTSKSEKAEIADGLENGADDFLTKPVSADELRARLRAGERILSMQAELVEKNRLVGVTLAELQKVYDSLDRDLIEARKLQESLIRDRYLDFGSGRAAILIRPSGHVGGDRVGSFAIDSRRVAIFSVDVSGHGVASAMMTARLAGLLSGGTPDQNVALRVNESGLRDAWPAAQVAARLNRLMLEEIKVEQYFTLAYAEVDLLSGAVELVQAGHPHPLVLRRGGTVELVGRGGLPIGLIAGADFETVNFHLRPGDRLFLASDGMTECPDPDGAELGSDGLAALVGRIADLPISDLLEALIWDLTAYAGGGDFPDDVSGILFEFTGSPPG